MSDHMIDSIVWAKMSKGFLMPKLAPFNHTEPEGAYHTKPEQNMPGAFVANVFVPGERPYIVVGIIEEAQLDTRGDEYAVKVAVHNDRGQKLTGYTVRVPMAAATQGAPSVFPTVREKRAGAVREAITQVCQAIVAKNGGVA